MVRDAGSIYRILDHGYVALIEHWGSDERIIESARMSTISTKDENGVYYFKDIGGGFRGWGPSTYIECTNLQVCPGYSYQCNLSVEETIAYRRDALGLGMRCPTCSASLLVNEEKGRTHGDEKLLAFLWKNGHTSPFEQCGATFEIKAPIFIFREWHRHRTQSYNEMSARYTPLPNENYVPTPERCEPQDTNNKQAQGSVKRVPTEQEISEWLQMLTESYEHSEIVYHQGLELGIPKEIARLSVPVARYSVMRASANLWNWMRFLKLRMASNAQWEIQEYARAVCAELGERFPRTMELFEETR